MASPSQQPATATTRARSIETLDGYVSRGRAPPSSVPRDHAMLQDFAAFLELRLKSQNVSILRRIFADFLNEQENTLVPMMRQGVTIVTLFPVLRMSPRRLREAQRLLAKPKSLLDPRGCVFLYLQYRAATRNMALLKHMFLEFVGHKETSLLRFVERGNEVISVIPFELPRVVLPASVVAAPVQQQAESPRSVESAVEQPVEAEGKRRKTSSKKRKTRAVAKPVAPPRSEEQCTTSQVSTEKQPAAATQQESPQVAETGVGQQPAGAGVKRRKTRSKERGKRTITKQAEPKESAPASPGSEELSATSSMSSEQQSAVAQQESPQVAETTAGQQPVESEGKRRKTRSKERQQRAVSKRAEPEESAPASPVPSEKHQTAVNSNASADVSQVKRGRRKNVEVQDDAPVATAATQQQASAVAAEPERVQNKRRSRRLSGAADATAGAASIVTDPSTSEDKQDKRGEAGSSRSGDAEVKRGRPKKVDKKGNGSPPAATQQQGVTGAVESERVDRRRSRRISDAAAAANTEPAASEDNEDSSASVARSAAVESSPTRVKEPKSSPESQEKAAATPVEVTAAPVPVTPVKAAALPATATPIEAPQNPPKAKRGRKRKADADKQKDGAKPTVKSHKRGKPVMSEAMSHNQQELTRKMNAFEAQIPWEAVFGKLPLPFDEEKHPELAKKLHRFWHRHSRAVWERKFWAPMSRKTNAFAFNKRNNRQISAKNAFEAIIIAAYEQLGAAFFVKLDTQQPRHPGWWYRGPVVALFALHEVKGEDAVWDYVKNEALERFPDCKLPIPIKAPNYGAVQNCHKSASDSMWMANHPLTPTWLDEIAALKAKQQACETSGEETAASKASEEPDGDSETVVDALGFT